MKSVIYIIFLFCFLCDWFGYPVVSGIIAAMKTPSDNVSHSVESPALAQVVILSVDEEQAGQRLDNFLIARLKGVPKSKIYNVIRKGEVRVNKGRIKPEYKLVAGDSVRIPPIRTAEAGTEAKASHQIISLLAKSILFEDDG